jgi:CHAT domain-containing protein
MKKLFTLIALLYGMVGICQNNTLEQTYKDGFAFYQQNQLPKALGCFEKIYTADTTEFAALEYACFIYSQTKQYEKAANGLARLCMNFPEKDNFFSSACFNYVLINKPKLAEAYGKKAVALNARQYNNMLNLGHAYFLQYKPKEAIYWYLKGLEWVTSKTDFERSYLGDFDVLDSLQLVPTKFIDQFKKGLSNQFATLNLTSKSTIVLDSILKYNGKIKTAVDGEKLLQWKNDFIVAESKLATVRYTVMASFLVDIGIHEYQKRNRAIALNDYLARAETIYTNIGDSLSLAKLKIFLSSELLAYQTAENKYSKNNDALSYAKEARELVEKYHIKELNSTSLKYLSDAYFQQDDDVNGLACLRQLYQWASSTNDGKGYFWATNGLSVHFAGNKQLDSALYYNMLCLSNISTAGITRESNAQVKLNGIDILYSQKKYEKVIIDGNKLLKDIAYYQNAIYAGVSELVGESYDALGNPDSAYVFYRRAFYSHVNYSKYVEKEKLDAPQLQVSEARKASLWGLCAIAAAKKDTKDLFFWMEKMKDNYLRYLISFQYQPEYTIPFDTAQSKLPQDAAAIMYIGTSQGEAASLAFDSKTSVINSITEHQTLAQLHQYNLQNTFAKLLQLLKTTATSTNDSAYTTRSLPLMQYLYLSNTNPAGVRGVTTLKRADESATAAFAADKIALSKLLYVSYLKPFEDLIKGKKTLYISADFMQHFIPFETLLMPDGRYVAEVYDIIYTPSFTIADYLADRAYNTGSSIVAAGNPDYNSYHPEKLTGRALDFSLFGLKKWTDLPGTQQELNMLQQQFDSVTVYTQQQLSETNLKKWSKEGKLNKAAILHFALHGIAGTTTAKEDNSLVVTEPNGGKEDGLLQFTEAYELDIKPQLVCLSACETGLGMITIDGSLATMGTVFLAAGAKAVLTTNWTIDDAATALFIKDVYQQVKETNIGFAQAVANTKRKFIKGDFGEKYKKPYYWAPFKYYGN